MCFARSLAAAPVPEGIVARRAAGVGAGRARRGARRAGALRLFFWAPPTAPDPDFGRAGGASGANHRPRPRHRRRAHSAKPPHGILFNTVNPRFHHWTMSGPTPAVAFADHALATSRRAADRPIDLSVRKDKIALRPSFPAPSPARSGRLGRFARFRFACAAGPWRAAPARLSTSLGFCGCGKESFTDAA